MTNDNEQMTTLVLEEPNLVESLKQVALSQNTKGETLLIQAVTEFLARLAEQKIEQESRAFEKLHYQLLPQYLGQYVAIHQANVVDHDLDLRTLHLRVRQQFGRVPVLLRQVTEKATPPELHFRSTRLDAAL